MRTSGILMPIFSLDSPYGIGTLGKAAYEFVDFLKASGQTYWQILPVGITGFGDSPYQSVSSYAGNPYFIDLDFLVRDGLLTKAQVDSFEWESEKGIDYELLYKNRSKILHLAFERFLKKIPEDFYSFESENAEWLEDFALYSAIKENQNGASFDLWPKEFAYEKVKDKDILKQSRDFYKMLQYLFFKQWFSLKDYANKNGVYIIGDIPIYVAYDSADVWSDKKQFLLDKNLKPKIVAGCPPDAFSDDGQLWGNPIYDWKFMKQDGFSWWIKRVGYLSRLYDVVRIDHFRAFSAYFGIPYGDKTAKNGKWYKCYGRQLFSLLNKTYGKLNIIAEDLGTIDDDVRKLLKFTGFPGMKVLQFAFDPDSESSYLPHNITKNCVVYTGTHDNDTAIGYLNSANEREVKFAKDYLRVSDGEQFNWALIKAAMATSADTVIFQMQDFLGLGNEARMNTPATEKGNWQWRIEKGCANAWLAKIIYDITKLYFRLPAQNPSKVNEKV